MTMTATAHIRRKVAEIAEAAVRDLVRVSHWGSSSFINLPLVFPDGSGVAVKLDFIGGDVRVSDNGFAYRVLEAIGAQRSFAKTAASIAESCELKIDRRTISVDVSPDFVPNAICEVATASWLVADRVFRRLPDEESEEIKEHLLDRLATIFPESLVREPTLKGASSHPWELSAVVSHGGHPTVFHAVGSHMQSVNKASTSFLDLANLSTPPRLVAVVKSKPDMAEKLTLLAQAGAHIIEETQADDDYRRAAG